MTINLETPEDTRQYALLTIGLDEPQAGPARYAAAMHFYMRGQMSEQELEAYRAACKAEDGARRAGDIVTGKP